MAGPTFINPHLETDIEAGWAMGFTWGFLGPAFSSALPLVIARDLVDAFNEGVLVGPQVAIDGIPIEPACLSLAQEVARQVPRLSWTPSMFSRLSVYSEPPGTSHTLRSRRWLGLSSS